MRLFYLIYFLSFLSVQHLYADQFGYADVWVHPTKNIVAVRTTFPFGASWSSSQQALAIYSVDNSTKQFLLVACIPGKINTASWSPDGTYLAIGGTSASMAYGGDSGFFDNNNLRIYQFNGISLTPIKSYNYPPVAGAQVVSISWQPGQTNPYYLAVSFTGGAGTYFYKLQRLSFSPSTATITVTNNAYASYVGQKDIGYLAWDPTGNYLAFTYYLEGSNPNAWLVIYSPNFAQLYAVGIGANPATGVAWNHTGDRLGVSTVGSANISGLSNYSQTQIYTWSPNTLASNLGIVSTDATGWNGALAWNNNDNYFCLYAGKGCTASNGGTSSDSNPVKVYAYTKGSPDTVTTVTSFSVNPSTDAITVYPSLSGAANCYVGQSTQGSVGWGANDQHLFAGCYGTRATSLYSIGSTNNDLRCYAWGMPLLPTGYQSPVPIASVDYGTMNAADSTGSNVTTAAWSPDGNYFAIGGINPTIAGGFSVSNQIRIYKFNPNLTLTPVASFNYGTTVKALAWSDDSTYLSVGGAGAGSDGINGGFSSSSSDIRVYALSGGMMLPITTAGSGGTSVNSLAWRTSSGGTKYLFAGCTGSSANIRIYSLSGSTLTSVISTTYTNNAQIYSLAVTPWINSAGTYLAIGTDRQGQEYALNMCVAAAAVYLFDGSNLTFKASIQDINDSPPTWSSSIYGSAWTPGGSSIGSSSLVIMPARFWFYKNVYKVSWRQSQVLANYVLGCAGLWCYSGKNSIAWCSIQDGQTGAGPHYTYYLDSIYQKTDLPPFSGTSNYHVGGIVPYSTTMTSNPLYNAYSFNSSALTLTPFNLIASGTTWSTYYKSSANNISYAMDWSGDGNFLLTHQVPSLVLDNNINGTAYQLASSVPDVHAFQITGTGIRIGAPWFDCSYGATVNAIVSRPGTKPSIFAVVGQNPTNDVSMSGFLNTDEIRLYAVNGQYPIQFASQTFGNEINTFDVTRPERGLAVSLSYTHTIAAGETVSGCVDLAGGIASVGTQLPIPTLATTQGIHDGDLDLTRGCIQLNGPLRLGPGSNILTCTQASPRGALYLNNQTLFLLSDISFTTTITKFQTCISFLSPGTIDGLGNNLSISGPVMITTNGSTSLNQHIFKNLTFTNLWNFSANGLWSAFYDDGGNGVIFDNVTFLTQPGKMVTIATKQITIKGTCNIIGGGTFTLKPYGSVNPIINIASGSRLYVGQGTTLNVYAINFTDQTSNLFLDGARLVNICESGPLYLTAGKLIYNGLVTMSSLHNSQFIFGDGVNAANDLALVGQPASTLNFDQITGCTGTSTLVYKNIH